MSDEVPNATVQIRRSTYRTAKMAAALTDQSLTDFVTAAVEQAAAPIVESFRSRETGKAEAAEAAVS